jgi:hypothetical protein
MRNPGAITSTGHFYGISRPTNQLDCCRLRRAATQADRDAKAAADAMVERFADSWNRTDGAAYGENYWPEAELVNTSGDILMAKRRSYKST